MSIGITSYRNALAPKICEGTRVVVVGAGSSGQAAVHLLVRTGAQVKVAEKEPNSIAPEFRSFLATHSIPIIGGEHKPEDFVGVDVIVTSPGVPYNLLRAMVEKTAEISPPENEIKIIAEMELALPYVTAPIIAVTGTAGKTTTASLIAAMLRKAGRNVFLGGNIGIPLSTYVLEKQTADVIVLECSSFQLLCCHSFHPKVAVLTNLTENHLDQHKDMQEYTDAKFKIFMHQTEYDFAIIHQDLVEEYKKRDFKAPTSVVKILTRFPESKLIGTHNALNAEAAFLACRGFGVSEEVAHKVLKNFTPLKHRLELIDTLNGVRYINDSKSTTVDSLIAAIKSFSEPIILLAGGKFKGGDLGSVVPLIKEHVKSVCLFGGSRELFESAWKGTVPITWDETIDQAFAHAQGLAKKGEVILLSPATASYDQFLNYMARGEHFRQLVKGS